MNKEEFIKKVIEMYNENFELNGIYGHYIIPLNNQQEEEFLYNAINEINVNGFFKARQQYVKQMFEQIKKNKTLKDWENYAKEFISGFDEEGKVKLKNE